MMMKFNLVAALVVCLYLGCVDATSLKNQEGHFNDIRERLGHFRDDKIFLDLYKIYATAFVLPLHKERSRDDYRNYLPSGDECMVFLRKYRIDDYVLRDLDDFVVLDACLGYLYESTYHDQDKETSLTLRENLEEYQNDLKLKDFFDGTKVDGLSLDSKKCVANLLVHAIQAKKQYPNVVCNNHWLDLFNKFADCQGEILPTKDDDTYLSALYELVKRRANECFNNEISTLNAAIRTEYANNPFSVIVNKISWDKLRQQQGERFYPTKLATVLRAIQGTDDEINVREIANIVRGVGQDEKSFKDRLLRNMATFANDKIKPNGWHFHKKTKGVNDPTGVQRYDDMVDDMCNFFRTSNTENFYDFVTPFTRMIAMLKHEEIFGITKLEFVDKILKHSFETGGLYLAVSGCNILSYTEGQFIRKPENHELHYMVVFKRNTSKMVRWPDVGYY